MKLLTKEVKDKLPKIGKGKGMAPVKFFDPCGSFTWYVSEFDGEDLFFCFVTSSMCPEGEYGYTSLKELSEYRGRFGLGIERDLWWTEKAIEDIRKNL